MPPPSEPRRPHVTRLSREINVEMRNQHGDSLSWKNTSLLSLTQEEDFYGEKNCPLGT